MLRLNAEKDENLYLHHVLKLTLLKGEAEWERLMLQRRSKTLAVCESCLQRIHNHVNNICQTTMESRIHRNGHVRFGGKHLKTCYRKIVRP